MNGTETADLVSESSRHSAGYNGRMCLIALQYDDFQPESQRLLPAKLTQTLSLTNSAHDCICPVKIRHRREPSAHIREMQLLRHYGELALWEFLATIISMLLVAFSHSHSGWLTLK